MSVFVVMVQQFETVMVVSVFATLAEAQVECERIERAGFADCSVYVVCKDLGAHADLTKLAGNLF